MLIPVGEVIGLRLDSGTVTVAAYDDALGSAAREAGLKIGDQILRIDGTAVHSAEDVRSRLGAKPQELTIRRGGKLTALHLTPCQTGDGPRLGVYLRQGIATPCQTGDGPRLGVYLRQGIAGIGTVTFYDPQSGLFGTLGHGVSDAKGKLLPMTQGQAYTARIQAVKKGTSGHPGQLKGDAGQVCGTLHRNTAQGVFGKTRQGWKGQPLPLAEYEAIETGPAVIRCQVETGPAVIRCQVTQGPSQEYSVEILKIYPETRPDGRNFLLKVTDPALLQATGGIVQGMSGSPIIQNGQLIGAVTHVLVNDKPPAASSRACPAAPSSKTAS